jgi:hypothetical protein
LPISVADHLSPLFRDIFPDSEIAQAYASAGTKTSCILNGSLAPYFKSALIDIMKNSAFSITVDGSNDNGLEKMNPLAVRFFDERCGLVSTQLLDMCLTSGIIYQVMLNDSNTLYTGVNAGAAETIFNKIDNVLTTNGIDWSNCVGAGVDNTSVNLGVQNSISTRVLNKNPAIYFMGCPCHIIHNVALKASSSFTLVSYLT